MKGRDGAGRVGAVERSLWLQSGALVALGTQVWRQLVLLTLAELGTGAVCLPPWAWSSRCGRKSVQLQLFESPPGLV